ncbi:hypothetical protein WR25_06230 [Diploscapter pachys]|uniref:BHLH domain-containing protein n=1 Tax=Diploscapter pachys TaxID=2018661 RepID=A0A2A2M078_9BILA|nr:hypothetical protein WR25_06230 [Diploscapter pachys]
MVRSESADEEMMVNVDDEDWKVGDVKQRHQQMMATANEAHRHANRPPSRHASSLSPTSTDPDRKLRRQIANCNERRRMQSINAGFQSLRALLPRKEGEKLSKAAILQQTADLIHHLQNERTRLLCDREGAGGKKARTEYAVEDESSREVIDRLQCALERERAARVYLEQQLNQLKESYAQTQTLSPSTNNNSGSGSPREASVIRPTPLTPISVDVSGHLPAVVTLSSPQPLLSSAAASVLSSRHSSAFTSSAPYPNSKASSNGPSANANRSLQTILDAIRILESPLTAQAPLVR